MNTSGLKVTDSLLIFNTSQLQYSAESWSCYACAETSFSCFFLTLYCIFFSHSFYSQLSCTSQFVLQCFITSLSHHPVSSVYGNGFHSIRVHQWFREDVSLKELVNRHSAGLERQHATQLHAFFSTAAPQPCSCSATCSRIKCTRARLL